MKKAQGTVEYIIVIGLIIIVIFALLLAIGGELKKVIMQEPTSSVQQTEKNE